MGYNVPPVVDSNILIINLMLFNMKINYLSGSITIRQCDGYTENLEFNVTESKGLSFRYPYGEATPEEAEAISQFIKTVTNAYNKLTTQIDGANRDLHLEQYAPKVSVAETSSDTEPESASPQSCALGGGEGLTVSQIVKYATETEIQDAPFEETKTLAQQIEDNVIESLGLK